MDNEEKKVKKSDGKRQTEILIGIAMIILAAVFAYFAVSQPRVDSGEKITNNSGYSQQIEAANTVTTEAPVTENPQTVEKPATEATPQATAPAVTETKPQANDTPSKAPGVTPTEAKPTQAPTEAKTTSPTASVQYPLNLNTCTAEELMTIKGIGEARASAIIAYREYLGGYTDVNQLKNISGIGDGIFAKLEPYVTV